MPPPAVPGPGWTRPIRIPGSITITHADPPFATTGETGTWKLPWVLSRPVPAGSILHFQLQGGRNNRVGFQSAQAEHPAAEGYLSAWLDDGTRLPMQTVKQDREFSLTMPDRELPVGTRIIITLGDTTHGSPGIRTTNGYLLNKFFVLFLPPTGPDTPSWAGGGVWNAGTGTDIVAVCTLHLLGGPVSAIRAYAPAAVRPGVRFPILVRPEDIHGNRANAAPAELTVALEGRPLNVERVPVPGSTCVQLLVMLDREGTHRLDVTVPGVSLHATTNPVVCSSTASPRYWGMIHGHTEMSDGTGALQEYFRQLQHDVQLDFAASSDHDHLWETPDNFWQTTGTIVDRWNQPGRFATLLGYEWAKWRQNGDGDRNVYYRNGNRPIYRSDDGHHPSPPDLFKALSENREQALIIPHHTGHGGNFCDWKDHDPAFERLVEIFQVRGSYECAPEDGNPVPEKPGSQKPFTDGYVRNALAMGWRIGFTAGGDDHRGDWGTERINENTYKQGLMCVAADTLTREAIFDALYRRRVTATTGPRILLDWTLNGLPMGSEIRAGDLAENGSSRHLHITFHGTAPADRIDIIRNNRIIHSVPGRGHLDIEQEWVDAESIAQTWLPAARHCPHPFTFYYIRAVQTDNEVTWASPIWIDP
ncbi:MAG: hypothetical protein A2340_12230 [Lentisphaerae bacterium RIFOXYB12_FULL_60_10]|nr:MAG: hypothetical protein A2340_12230 [Lentisphaerae bacterium RIFOXYB12_FULL_60_10]